MNKRLIVSLLLLFSLSFVSAQDADEFDYDSEFVYGVMLSTNGGLPSGIMTKYSKKLKRNQYHSFGVEIAHIKHPKELRFADRATGNSYIYNKLNYLFSIRPQYGREFVLFRKAAEEGIHLNAIFAAGPSLGLVKPYHILWEFPTNNVTSVPYDPNKHNFLNIRGAGSFFDGFERSSFNIGAHFKTALSFEFGISNGSVIGLEGGLTFEAFSKTTQLMAFSKNTNAFSIGFITLYYGNKN